MSSGSEHRLSPPERWFAGLMLKRQQKPTEAVLRLRSNYGPDGMNLFASALRWGLCEILVGVAFFVALVASNGGSLATDVLLGLVVILFLLALFRGRQVVEAGRAFRGDRPFLKRQRR